VIDRLRLGHFRNHAATRLDGTAKFNLLVGENGAGKTNVLEALSLLAPGRGLRRAALAEMAARGGPGGFSLSADLAGAQGPVRLGTGMAPERPGRRLVQVNGAEAAATMLGEWLGVFWLTPAMDRLFTDSAGARRRLLDRMMTALQPGHARHAARVEAALRERNRLLGNESMPDPRWLEAVEAQLAEAGAALAAGRAELVARLNARLAELPVAPFARPLLAYRPGGPLDAGALAAALANGRARDRAAGRTLTGPHRDELDVTMAGKDQPAALCSTGEQKAMLIALTLAHCDLDAGQGRARLLLLDEVAAHLDPRRRAALFERLADGPAQIWITGTEAEPFAALLAEAAGWRVAGGSAEPL
jgi:DNA replication and repair protein RecF